MGLEDPATKIMSENGLANGGLSLIFAPENDILDSRGNGRYIGLAPHLLEDETNGSFHPLIIIGSISLDNGCLSTESRIRLIFGHEIAHYLTLVASYRKNGDGTCSRPKHDIYKSLGIPLWEGIADVLSDLLGHSIEEAILTDDSALAEILYRSSNDKIPAISLIETEDRTVGGLSIFANQLVWEIVLRAWHENSRPRDIHVLKPDSEYYQCEPQKTAAEAFIFAINRLDPRISKDNPGWLAKEIIPNLDLFLSTVKRNPEIVMNYARERVAPYAPHCTIEEMPVLLQFLKTLEYKISQVPNWQQYGEDSLC